MTNCPNCGALISGRECEYCGTKFYLKEAEETIYTLKLELNKLYAQKAQQEINYYMLNRLKGK